MNNYQLNAAQLGSTAIPSAVTLSGGAVSVLAVGVGKVVSYGIRDFIGSIRAYADTVGKFGAVYSVKGASSAAAISSMFYRLNQLTWGASSPAASLSGKAKSGQQQTAFAATVPTVTTSWKTKVLIALKGAALPAASLTFGYGYKYKVYGTGLAASATTSAYFTTFGLYAPEERTMLVESEDRKVLVV